MSKYVMSDLHGEYDKFLKMLKLIDFKDTDTLYILGDVFDRGNKPLEIIDYIVAHKNIVLLKGNHEKMFEEAFESGDYSLWYYNGGHTPTCLIDETLTECKILNQNNTIYIDCGACFTKDKRCSLACLRLDDMKEFYVK